MDTVNVKINGRDYVVPKNATVLEAAKAAKIDIPTLCYLKDINEIGACRLCLVEVSEGGRPYRMVTACVYPVSEGMSVLTNTPKNIDMDCASGNVNITLPSDTGFIIRMDSLSGRYYSEFPTTISGSDYIYGDGRCEIEMDSLSGDIKIYSAK